jgi:hypothetical protein
MKMQLLSDKFEFVPLHLAYPRFLVNKLAIEPADPEIGQDSAWPDQTGICCFGCK